MTSAENNNNVHFFIQRVDSILALNSTKSNRTILPIFPICHITTHHQPTINIHVCEEVMHNGYIKHLNRVMCFFKYRIDDILC